MQRCNQFDQFSQLVEREKSRRGIWSRDLTCDHIPKAVVHGIRPEEGSVAIALRMVEVGFQTCAEI